MCGALPRRHYDAFSLANKSRSVIVVKLRRSAVKTLANRFSLPFWTVYFYMALSAQGQFIGGLTASSMTLHGNNVQMDSYDSTDPNHSVWQTNLFFQGHNYGIWSTNLGYDTNSLPARTAHFHLAAMTNFIDVGNSRVYGDLHTTPGGIANVGSQGSVGDLNWVHVGNNGLQVAHFRDDMNLVYTSDQLPSNFTNSVQTNKWLPVATGHAALTNIIEIGCIFSNGVKILAGQLYTNKNNSGWILPNGDGTTSTYVMVITNQPVATNHIYYAMDSLATGNLFIDAPYTVLYLTNGMSAPTITLNTNANIVIYSGGDVTLGLIHNLTAYSPALEFHDILGHPIFVSGFANYSGTYRLYVPGAAVTLNGGGLNTIDIVGDIVCKSITVNGHISLHFDEALATVLPIPPLVFSPPGQAVLLGSNTTFSVISSGAPPITYSWFFETNLVSTMTNSPSLTLTNVPLSDTGYYQIIATNAFGAMTSSPTLLFVYTNADQLVPRLGTTSIINGGLQFGVTGVTGLNYSVQASTNLINWTSFALKTAPFTFTNSVTNVPNRFYRAVYFP